MNYERTDSAPGYARGYSSMTDYKMSMAEAQADMAYDFVKAIEDGEPNATPEWTGTQLDYEEGRKRGIRYDSPLMPRRRSTVAECLQSGLDYSNGPDMGDVLKVLSIAMKSSDPTVSLAARQLVERAAEKFAEMNAGDDK